MFVMQYIVPMLLSSFTGWLVVWLCTKLLFHPRKPVQVAGLTLQGAIPANQQMIADKIGKLVSAELFSLDALQDKITHPDNFNKLKPEIETHIDRFLRERLKDHFPMLAMLIGNKTITQLKSAFILELETLFPVIMNSYISRLQNELDLEGTVSRKIAGFSIHRAEQLINRLASNQLLKLRLFGALIGLLMGIVHMLINLQIYG
jgi:uncharacterized membrane protein YheB (UPF0754 family)